MHTTLLLLLATASVLMHANQDRPRVAWVPIETRNISELVGKALEGSEERLVRIGKMLTESYDKITRDTEEGEAKIRQLEETNASSPQLTAMTTITMAFYMTHVFS